MAPVRVCGDHLPGEREGLRRRHGAGRTAVRRPAVRLVRPGASCRRGDGGGDADRRHRPPLCDAVPLRCGRAGLCLLPRRRRQPLVHPRAGGGRDLRAGDAWRGVRPLLPGRLRDPGRDRRLRVRGVRRRLLVHPAAQCRRHAGARDPYRNGAARRQADLGLQRRRRRPDLPDGTGRERGVPGMGGDGRRAALRRAGLPRRPVDAPCHVRGLRHAAGRLPDRPGRGSMVHRPDRRGRLDRGGNGFRRLGECLQLPRRGSGAVPGRPGPPGPLDGRPQGDARAPQAQGDRDARLPCRRHERRRRGRRRG